MIQGLGAWLRAGGAPGAAAAIGILGAALFVGLGLLFERLTAE